MKSNGRLVFAIYMCVGVFILGSMTDNVCFGFGACSDDLSKSLQFSFRIKIIIIYYNHNRDAQRHFLLIRRIDLMSNSRAISLINIVILSHFNR